MVKILFFIFIGLSGRAIAQQYALLDKRMYVSVTYTNTVTLQDEYKNMFPVEKDKIPKFLDALKEVAGILSKTNKPATFNFDVGNTHFYGIKVKKPGEERMDVVITTDCGTKKLKMHLSDENVSNASNIFFVNAWADYIRGSIRN